MENNKWRNDSKEVCRNGQYQSRERLKKTLLKWGILGLLLFQATWAEAQNKKYLILLNDKNNSPYSVSKPEVFLSQRSIERRKRQGIPITTRDLPVNPSYIAAIKQAGAQVLYSSRWLNAVLISTNSSVYNAVKKLSFVIGAEGNRSLDEQNVPVKESKSGKMEVMSETAPVYGYTSNQIKMLGVDKMHAAGYRGETMLIGVLDNGFNNVNKNPVFQHLFKENRIAATYDFVNNETNVYNQGDHGTSVLSTIAAFKDSSLVGTAFKATFVLLHTEDDLRESKVEEANWLFGAEYADSCGVDVINTSLGYTEFDDATTDYTYQNMDGKTALVTRAADWAVGVGMVVCASAGNEGNQAWKYIGAPADGDSVLAVGAVDLNLKKASFSSFGPSADQRIKPDVVALGQGTTTSSVAGNVASSNGTSFSSPLVSGLVAGFWQAFPYLNAYQVVQTIKKAGSQASKPDNSLGYGIPTFDRAFDLAPKPSGLQERRDDLVKIYPNPFIGDVNPIIEFQNYQVNKPLEADLYDFTGKIVWKGQILPNDSVLPIGKVPSGFYVLNLKNDSVYQVIKLLKQ